MWRRRGVAARATVHPRQHARGHAAAGRRHHPHRRRARGRPGALAACVRRRDTAAVVRARLPRRAAGRGRAGGARGGPARRGRRSASALVSGLLLQLVLTFVPNNWWEEVAWSGFAQARLQARYGSAAKAALVAGPLFALQHVSLAAAAGWTAGSVMMGLLILVAIPFRFLTGWAYNRTGKPVPGRPRARDGQRRRRGERVRRRLPATPLPGPGHAGRADAPAGVRR